MLIVGLIEDNFLFLIFHHAGIVGIVYVSVPTQLDLFVIFLFVVIDCVDGTNFVVHGKCNYNVG